MQVDSLTLQRWPSLAGRNGRSPVVRLPKAFRFESLTSVFIARDGDRVILSPGRRPSIEGLIRALVQFKSFLDREQHSAPDLREAL